jgi:hypothetical protein
VYVWLGLVSDEAVLSPNVHEYVGVGSPVDVLVKFTVSGASPDVGEALNEAVGGVGVGSVTP